MSKTSTEYKSKAIWFEVTMIQEFTRTVQILAVDKEEAGEIAENRARRARALARFGYSLGDVEVIDSTELEFIHGNNKGLIK